MASPRQVLTISSQVAAGPVGNSAIVPALLALGVTPIALPTIILSNHPGHGRPEGLAVPAEKLAAMLQRLIALGFFAEDVVILTGYFAHAEQIDAVASIIPHVQKAAYLCDPVLGDSPKGLYVPEDVANAIRDRLVPMADILTPNAFELGWLTGHDVHDKETAREACLPFSGKDVVVTSIAGADSLATARIGRNRIMSVTRPKRAGVPNGTGDLLSGLLAGCTARDNSLSDESVGFAVAAVEHVIGLSAGSTSLDLARGLKDIGSVKPFDADQ